MLPNKQTKGICECCDNTEVVQLYPQHGMMMCESCRDKEISVVKQQVEVNALLLESRRIDSSIQIKTDIFRAKTIAAVELRAAIVADESNDTEEKVEYAFSREGMIRFKKLQKEIFDDRAALNEKENEARMWQTQIQESAGKLSTKLRAEFHELDVNYTPVKVKKIKPAVVPIKKYNKTELFEAAKKYSVDMGMVRAMMISNPNLTAEEAAKEVAKLMGLL